MTAYIQGVFLICLSCVYIMYVQNIFSCFLGMYVSVAYRCCHVVASAVLSPKCHPQKKGTVPVLSYKCCIVAMVLKALKCVLCQLLLHIYIFSLKNGSAQNVRKRWSSSVSMNILVRLPMVNSIFLQPLPCLRLM